MSVVLCSYLSTNRSLIMYIALKTTKSITLWWNIVSKLHRKMLITTKCIEISDLIMTISFSFFRLNLVVQSFIAHNTNIISFII